MNHREWLKKIEQIINPTPVVGGLEIDDTGIKFLKISGTGIKKEGLRFAPGIVQGGKIIDKNTVESALKAIHKKIVSEKEIVPVVFLVPSENLYIQTFTVPNVGPDALPETANLNLQILSPLPFEKVYASWQTIGTPEENMDNSEELLGAFIEKEIVDEFEKIAVRAGFSFVAVEFSALAVSRVIIKEGVEIKKEKAYIVIFFTRGGIEMLIIKNEHLHFHRYTPWTFFSQDIKEAKINTAHLKEFLENEIRQIINFYTARWGNAPEESIIIGEPSLLSLIKTLPKENFPLNIKELSLKHFPDTGIIWLSVLGSALRGLIPRSGDTMVSLAGTSAYTNYIQPRAMHIARFWRKFFVTSGVFFIIAWSVLNVFVMREKNNVKKKMENNPGAINVEEYAQLKERAENLNNEIKLVSLVSAQNPEFSALIKLINNNAENLATIEHLSVSNDGISLGGFSKSQDMVFTFKSMLEKSGSFEAISLPLSNIKISEDESARFNLTAKLKAR